ncbi:DUF1330 domain-containing protein [Mycobacterium colombiense]|uniref:DUF1330 domain-containing protein n=1 Tax=Mycobacterium colombiense TaxID=339268 RepID=UPI00200A8F1C|nr:DUF1330 domain-containing protein [Mycobacterium colombiense]MCK8647117.1 DUF1330 domain-containing protein [Mycobacterium colombiense]
MSTYMVARVTVTDPSWIESYMPAVRAQVEARGGRYLVVNHELDVVEQVDAPPTVVVVAEFPNKDAAYDLYNSAEYRPFLEARKAGSKSEVILVEGL